MATKYQMITEMYNYELERIISTPAAWTTFLRSACRNYKLRFDEQILLYAQRPDATAVLEIEKWNDIFKRWVNRDAKGIAVFDDEHNGNYRLKHYFDISDTHGGRLERPVPIWNMKPEYEAEVIESLINSFGDLDNSDDMAQALISVTKNAVEDNITDYLHDLMYSREDSFLEDLDDLNVEVEYRTTLQNSVAYMLLTRCGIDTDEYFDADDFRYLYDFNTRDTINAIGLASSDIAEMCLREISATVLNLQQREKNQNQKQKQNRTFANPETPAHNVPNKTINEGSVEHGRTDISDGGRLPNPEPDRTGRTARSPWQVRITPKEIPETEPTRSISELPDSRNSEHAPNGDRTDSQRADGTDKLADGTVQGRDRGTESQRPDEMGRADEQHPSQRGGNDTERPDICIKPLPTYNEQLANLGEAEGEKATSPTPPLFSISQQIIENSALDKPPSGEPVQYDLQLGATVYLGIEEYIINAIDDTRVVLRDVNAPLFTAELPRDEFDRKLRENSLNDGLIITSDLEPKASPMPEQANEPKPYTPKHGDRYKIQGRFFIVDEVDIDRGNISLQDVTFENNTGFPIFRKEKLDFIHLYDPIPQQPGYEEWSEPATSDNAPNKPGAPSDDVGSYLPKPELKPRPEAEPKPEPQPKPPDTGITPSWEKKRTPERQSRATIFDPHPEIPHSDRHNFRIMDDNLGVGGAKVKFHYNVDAIKTLQAIELENRFATPEEQQILSRYVGWGALQQAFDPDNKQWENEYSELTALLTPDEYTSARATTLNAHYTTPTIIKAIYKAIENTGFKIGNIFDPGCGIGNFQGLLPDSMEGSKVFGVEIDPITGRIAQQLYQKNSIAIQGYEDAILPDSFFDLAIGNVPFGGYSLVDKKYDKYKFKIHDYFFAKTLDKVRSGGVIAFITSRYTMDKLNPAVRKYIAQRAELLGAIRLPNDAFMANAGTQVTTDIIFLQKRDHMVDIEPDWVHLGQTEDGFTINSYFVDNPDMILGTMSSENGTRMYGNTNDITCMPFQDRDLADLLDEAIQNIHAEITDYERFDTELEEDSSIPADPAVQNFSYTVLDGKIYYRENSRMYHKVVPATAQSRIKGMIEIRECVRRLIAYQLEGYPDSDIKEERAKLNYLYDSYTDTYDILNDRANNKVFSDDESYPLLCSLEVLDENLNFKAKADMFTKRTINPKQVITHVDTSSEALAVSIEDCAKVDLNFMSGLTGMDRDTLIKDLEGVIFLNVGGAAGQSQTYVTADEYLSGNVRAKLNHARAAAAERGDGSLDINIRALEAVQPTDLTAPEITVRLGATWIPPEIYQQFMFELLGTPWRKRYKVKVLYSPHSAEWSITEKSADKSNVLATATYGTKRMNAYLIIEKTLNLRTLRIYDTMRDAEGREIQVLNKQATATAQDKQDIIKDKFEEWVWKDPDRREMLCKLYNEHFNSIRPREYDGSHIKFHGMNPEIKLDTHQVNAVARYVYGGNALFGHVVGAGKSYEMIASGMEAKRLGLCNKPMYVVPNNIIADFASDFFKLYPSANVLMVTEKDFEKRNRKKFCARIATGDYDGVIIAHSQFEKIPMSKERQCSSLEQQILDIAAGIKDIKEMGGERFTIKQLEKTKKSLETKLKKLNDQSRKDNLVTFEELGVDALFVDEADLFKNLYLVTKMRNVAGISQSESQKASDLFMKTRYLDEITGNRGVVFATGTPVSNSLAEVYTMQRYLQYDTLKEQGLAQFDCWASTFGETVTAIELTPEGNGFQMKTRFSSFHNLPELMALFKEVADIQTKDMLNLPTPKVNYHTIVAKPSDMQKEMITELGNRADRIRKREVSASEDNMLLITNDGRKIALDQRIINPLLPDHPESKVNICVDLVFSIWEETKEQRLTQLIFSDLATPKSDGSFSVYNDIKRKLTLAGFMKYEKYLNNKGITIQEIEQYITSGMPEGCWSGFAEKMMTKAGFDWLLKKCIPLNEVAFIHDAKNEIQKKEIVAKVRSGAIRVLIGSTSKMGAGMNAQDLLIASHDLDCPWRPRDLEQRSGRIERRGNRNPEVHIYRYVTEGTFDSYCYQIIENKQRGISQVFTSKSPMRVTQEIDEVTLNYAEIKALATGNPNIIERCKLDAEVNKLKTLKASHLSQRYELEDKIFKTYPAEIARLMEQIAGYEHDIDHAAAHPKPQGDKFIGMKIGDRFMEEKKEVGSAILEACKAMTSPAAVPLGEYRGFPMVLSYEAFGNEYRITLKGQLSHTVSLSADIYGNITRLDNALEGMGTKLQSCMEHLETVNTQLETTKEEVRVPFSREQELADKTERLAELTMELKLNEQDHEILDTEPDEGDIEPKQRAQEQER